MSYLHEQKFCDNYDGIKIPVYIKRKRLKASHNCVHSQGLTNINLRHQKIYVFDFEKIYIFNYDKAFRYK